MSERIKLLLWTLDEVQAGDILEVLSVDNEGCAVVRRVKPQTAAPPDIGVSVAETIAAEEKLS